MALNSSIPATNNGSVHGVRYDFPIEACRSAIAVANARAKINA